MPVPHARVALRLASVLALSTAFAAPTAEAAVTQKQAEKKAINALDLADGKAPVVLFRKLTTVPAGTKIRQAGPSSAKPKTSKPGRVSLREAGVQVVAAPVVLTSTGEPSWLFYEDRGPYQAYEHPGRVVLVGKTSGRVKISKTINWPPLIGSQLPSFLANYAAYRDPRYRAFVRSWKVAPGAVTSGPVAARAERAARAGNEKATPPLPSTLASDPEALAARREAARLLVEEGSCAIRISDTLGDFFDAGPVDATRAALGRVLHEISLVNPGFYTNWYRYADGTPAQSVAKAVSEKGCRDVLIYLAGGGTTVGQDPAINVGLKARKDGRLERQVLTATALRKLMGENPSVTFKVEVDAPQSGAFIAAIQGTPNLLLSASSTGGKGGSFTALGDVVNEAGSPVDNAFNPHGLLEFTNRQIVGLGCFLSRPEEVQAAARAKAEGRTKSFMAWMLARAFTLCGDGYLAEQVADAPAPPQLQLTFKAPTNLDLNQAPVASDKQVTTDEDTPVSFVLPATDSDGNELAFSVIDGPSHGTLTAGPGPARRTYTPNPDFTGEDSFTYSASDGRAKTPVKTVRITVNPVNDAPKVTLGGGTTTFTEGGSPVAVDPGVTLSDVDDTQLEGATVAIGAGFESGKDVLAFTAAPGITGSYNASSGVLTFTGSATLAAYQTLLRSVTFSNPDSALSSATRQVVFRATDGDVFGASADRPVTVAVVNDAPVLAGGGTSVTFVEDTATGPVVAPNVTVADVDSPNLASASVRIAAGLVALEDRLTFTAQPGITGVYDPPTGVLTFTGSATLADYQAILRSVRYRNANTADPATATRTIELQVDDGAVVNHASNVVTGTADVTAVNDAPTVSTSGASPAFTEGGAAVVVDSGILVGDVDGSVIVSATATITAGHAAGEDVLALPATPGLTANFNAGAGRLTITGNATPAAYQSALRTITYANTNGNNPSGATRTVQLVVDDGQPADHASAPADAAVVVSPVNDAPVLSNGGNTVNFTEDDATGVLVNSGIGVADVDSPTLAGAAVQITTAYDSTDDRLVFSAQNGITGSFDTSTGVLTLSGTASVADYQTALRSIRYRNLDTATPSSTQRVVTFTVNDGASSSNASNSVLSNVTVTPTDDAPVLAAGGGSPTFTEGGADVAVDPGLGATDPDSANLASATVQITGGLDTSDDRLVFVNTATITGVYTQATGTLSLTGSDTVANYRTALRSVQYRNLDTDNPSNAARTVSFTVSDGTLLSNTVTTTVNVTRVNDAPVLIASGGSAAFTEDGPSVAVDTGIALADVDDATLSGATVAITGNYVNGQDSLTFVNTAAITGSWNAAAGTLTLSGADSVSNYQAALRAVRFTNSSHTPNTATRTVTFGVADAGSAPASATRGVTVAAANDAPSLSAGGGSPSFTEGGPAVVVDPAIGVADLDGDPITGGTVVVGGNWSADDRLNFTNQNGITGSYNAGSGVLTLTGSASVANYQAALRSVTYSNVSGQPSTLQRSIDFQVTDGSANSNQVSTTVSVISNNTAPSLGGGGNTLAYTEDDPAAIVNGLVTALDPDDTSLDGATVSITGNFVTGEDQLTFSNTASITGSWSSVTGVLTLTGSDTVANYQAALRTVRYVNNNHSAPSTAGRTVTFVATDGEANSNSIATTVTVATSNDAPALTAGTGNVRTFTEGGSAVAVDDAITAADADSANFSGATVSITTGFAASEGDTLSFTNQSGITGSYNSGTGVLTLSGAATVANYQAALRSITFSNTSDAPTTPRTVTFVASDGGASSAGVTHDVTLQPVNDAPVLGAGGTLNYTENDAATAISAALTLTDADSPTITGATASITGGFQTGQDVLSFVNTVNITGSYNAGTGVLTLSGSDTVANYRTALRSVRYANSSEAPSTAARTVTFVATDNGAPGLTGTTTATVNVAAVNDAPVAVAVSHSGASAAIGNTSLVVDDPTDGAIDPAGPQKTISGDLLAGATDPDSSNLSVVAGTFATNDGGSFTVQADGDYVFTPAAGTSCTDTSDFATYSVTDNEAVPATDSEQITFAISGCVWYVDNSSAAGGDGTSSTPFDTLDEADVAATTTGAYLYVYNGTGTSTGLTDDVSLLASQRLIGGAAALTVGATTLHTANPANRPHLAGTVNVDDANTITGVEITSSATPAVRGGTGDAGGTLDDVTLLGTGGGLELNGTSGTWDVTNTSVTTTGGDAVLANNAGTVNFTSAGTNAVTSTSGRGLTLSGTTALSGVVDSITVNSSPTTGIALTGTTGSLTLDDVNVNSTGTGLAVSSANGITVNNSGNASVTSAGTAVDLNSDGVNPATQPVVTLTTATSTGGARGIRISDLGAGTFAAAGGSLTGQTATAVDIDGGTGNVTYGGTIGNGSGLSAQVTNRTGGAVAITGNINDTADAGGGVVVTGSSGSSSTLFSGGTKKLDTGASNAVTFSAAGAHTLTFSGGGLDLDATSGKGIAASGANGTIAVTGTANTATTTTGTAIDISGPDISALAATFQSVASNGAASGIVLADTGAAGGLHVTGTGGAGTGGTVTNSTGPGVSLTNTIDVQLASFNVTNGGDDGIRGSGVAGFQLTGSSQVTGNGNAAAESGIEMTELSGSAGNPVTVAGATITGNADDNFSVENDSATISSLSITGGTIGSNSTTLGNDGLRLRNSGTGDISGATISGVLFQNNRGDHIQISTDDSNSSDQTVSVLNNLLRGTGNQGGNTMAGGGISLGVGGAGNQTVVVDNNDIERAYGSAISLNTTTLSTGDARWTVSDNAIGTSGEVNSGSQSNVGIYGNVIGQADAFMLIENNTIMRTAFSSIDVVANDGDPDLHATVRGNAITEPGAAATFTYGVRFVFGSLATDEGHGCLDFGGTGAERNQIQGTGQGGFQDLRVRMAGGPLGTLKLIGYTGGINDTAAAAAYLAARNNLGVAPTVNASQVDGDYVVDNPETSCTLP